MLHGPFEAFLGLRVGCALPEQKDVAVADLEEGGDQPAKGLDRRAFFQPAGVDRAVGLLDRTIADRLYQLFAGREVPVEGGAPDAGGGGYLAHACGRIVDEQPGSVIEDGLAVPLGIGPPSIRATDRLCGSSTHRTSSPTRRAWTGRGWTHWLPHYISGSSSTERGRLEGPSSRPSSSPSDRAAAVRSV